MADLVTYSRPGRELLGFVFDPRSKLFNDEVTGDHVVHAGRGKSGDIYGFITGDTMFQIQPGDFVIPSTEREPARVMPALKFEQEGFQKHV